MTVYQRFFIEIKPGDEENVGAMIISILGGDGWINRSDKGEVLAPVEVTGGPEEEYVVPSRTEYGSVLADPGRTGSWWWLDFMFDYDSPEARALAHALMACQSVTRFAVDTDACESAEEAATIVNDTHYLLGSR